MSPSPRQHPTAPLVGLGPRKAQMSRLPGSIRLPPLLGLGRTKDSSMSPSPRLHPTAKLVGLGSEELLVSETFKPRAGGVAEAGRHSVNAFRPEQAICFSKHKPKPVYRATQNAESQTV
jgi:hypothetical protein